MADILQEIVATKRKELLQDEQRLSLSDLKKKVLSLDDRKAFSMKGSLAASDTGIIAEFKRKSPSKGWIKEQGKADVIPPSYAREGAAACSILTNEVYFGGSIDFVRTARPLTPVPILRKEFIISPYQVYEARLIEADAILLIAACLERKECLDLGHLAHDLGLEVLLEVHQEDELDYISDAVDMVGVNNRDLGTFHTDVKNSFRIAQKLPKEFLRISESGISNPRTVKELREAGFRGFLIGETFMKTEDPGLGLRDFINGIKNA